MDGPQQNEKIQVDLTGQKQAQENHEEDQPEQEDLSPEERVLKRAKENYEPLVGAQ